MKGKKVKKAPVSFRLDSIKVLEEKIDLKDHSDLSNSENFKYSLLFRLDVDAIKSILSVWVQYKLSSKESEKTLLDLQVTHNYAVKDIQSIVKGKEFINQDFVAHVLGISLTQTRGVQAYIVKDTPLDKFLIPLLHVPELLTRIQQKD